MCMHYLNMQYFFKSVNVSIIMEDCNSNDVFEQAYEMMLQVKSQYRDASCE